ncbi:hypothetical protein ACIP9H_26710 [Streptomyces sp. NPDC088732]|uniref:hypothetical protein n=1 Tax=Streptomyces sp. NPDC088732 TaxID=3365879 RepID=UPI0038301D2D
MPLTRSRPAGRACGHVAVLAAVTLAALAGLTACGGTADPSAERQVASLPASDAPAPPAGDADGTGTGTETQAGTGDAGPPQMRLDDTDERRNRLIRAWDDCLVAHGAQTGGPGPAGPVREGQPLNLVEPIPDSAKRPCAGKLPLGPKEENPALNPHYRENAQARVQCLRAKGVMVHLVKDTSVYPNGLGYTYDDDYVENDPVGESAIEHACELEAFSGKK